MVSPTQYFLSSKSWKKFLIILHKAEHNSCENLIQQQQKIPVSGFIVEATCQFDVWQKSKWMGTTMDTCRLSYSPGLKGFWSRVSSRCSSFSSSSCPWPWGQVPMCQAPLELLGQIMSSLQVSTVFLLAIFHSLNRWRSHKVHHKATIHDSYQQSIFDRVYFFLIKNVHFQWRQSSSVCSASASQLPPFFVSVSTIVWSTRMVPVDVMDVSTGMAWG